MSLTNDRRQFGRRASALQAWLVVPGRPRLACRVAKSSPDGALLELIPPAWLPFRFGLAMDGGVLRSCEIRYTGQHGFGVRFCQDVESAAEVISHGVVLVQEHWMGTAAAPSRKLAKSEGRR